MSKIVTFLLGAILCTPVSHAQTTSEISDSLQLDNVVITASKLPLSERETTKPVTVINRAEIKKNSGKNLSQLLQQQSGIQVNQAHGAPAENKTLYMQGAGSGYTLLLIDGLAVNDPSGVGGLFDIRMIPLESVERIEIIKGSQSTLYGTDAVAGVINIITQTETEKPINVNGLASYGQYNTFNGSVGANGQAANWLSYRINYSKETTDGFSAATQPDEFNSDENTEFEDDGFNRDAFSGRINLQPVESVTISPSLNYSVFDGDYDGGAFQESDNRFEMDVLNLGVTAQYQNDNVRVFSGYNYTHSDRLFDGEGMDESEFEGKLNNFDTYATYQVTSTFQFLGGINYQNTTLPGGEEQESVNADIISPYATVFLRGVNNINAELGVRLNNHSEYENNTTVSFAPSYNITDDIKLFGSVGTGFKTPTLDELFGPFGANPDLNPEKSRYLNGGIETYFSDRSLKLSAQYFHRRIDDVIAFSNQGQYINRDQQDDNGIELSADWIASSSIRVAAHYNYLTGEVTTVDENGDEIKTDNLLRRPTHSFGGSVDLSLTQDFLVQFEGEYNSERDDSFYNTDTFTTEDVILNSYSLFHIYSEYSLFNGQLSLFANVQNLFNSNFTEVYGFNTSGTRATAGLRFNL